MYLNPNERELRRIKKWKAFCLLAKRFPMLFKIGFVQCVDGSSYGELYENYGDVWKTVDDVLSCERTFELAAECSNFMLGSEIINNLQPGQRVMIPRPSKESLTKLGDLLGIPRKNSRLIKEPDWFYRRRLIRNIKRNGDRK